MPDVFGHLAFFINISLVLIFISCQSNIIKKDLFVRDKTYLLKSSDEINPYNSICIQKDSQSYFCYYDVNNHVLKIYKKTTNNVYLKDKSIKINDNFNKVIVYNLDSILLINSKLGEIVMINFKNDTIDSFLIPLLLNNVEYKIVVHSYGAVSINSEEIVFTIFPSVSLEKFYNFNYELEYSFQSRKIINHFLTFPLTYKYTHWWGGLGNHYEKCKNVEGDIIYSFPMTNNLFMYKRNILTEIKVEKSKYLNDFPPKQIVTDSLMSSKYVINFANTTGFYKSLYFDSYHNYYLRVVSHEQSAFKMDSQGYKTQNLYNDRDWSIMIFDLKFHLIGEQKFNGGEFNFKSIYIIPEGIMLAKINENSLDNEDFIKLQLFKYKFDEN
ncbi:MAG: hypothetical protein IPL42_12260 [Saprospiraceae bacterium]|nr:hypothetical protein [Saprospiraceae bacterium]